MEGVGVGGGGGKAMPVCLPRPTQQPTPIRTRYTTRLSKIPRYLKPSTVEPWEIEDAWKVRTWDENIPIRKLRSGRFVRRDYWAWFPFPPVCPFTFSSMPAWPDPARWYCIYTTHLLRPRDRWFGLCFRLGGRRTLLPVKGSILLPSLDETGGLAAGETQPRENGDIGHKTNKYT
jgi:hypothetical protein